MDKAKLAALAQSFLQGASNSAASTVSAPVDALAWGLRKAGVPVPAAPVGGSDWMALRGLMRQPENALAGLVGESVGGVAPILAGAYAPQIAGAVLAAGRNAAAPRTLHPQAGVVNFDPRFDPRAKEAARLAALAPQVSPRPMMPAPTISLADLEGKPFVTSMSDRTAAGGHLTGINGVAIDRPVNLQGGQDFMFDNPGQVWASAQQPVKQILGLAGDLKRVTGQDPLFIPWRMAPTGGDFASMTGETMLSYAAANMGKKDQRSLDSAIREFIPGWSGVASGASVSQFRAAPDQVRKSIKNMMDTNFRARGGLSIGEARLSVADPKQLQGADGQIMNVGSIAADLPMVTNSGHVAYPRGVPGEGLGRIAGDHNVFDLLPTVVAARGMTGAPAPNDLRALQMKPYAGVIDANLLKRLGY